MSSIFLVPPAKSTRIAISLAWLSADAPGRIALQALALALSWPSPPWEAEAQLALERASQEEKECRQFLLAARPEEKSAARSQLFDARGTLDRATAALAALKPDLHNPVVAGQLALEWLASVPIASWLPASISLIQAWNAEVLPAEEAQIAELLTFSLPPPGSGSGGGSSSPDAIAATPSAG